MADKAISGLTELEEATEGRELIETVDVSEAVAADRSKQRTITELFNTVVTLAGALVCDEGNIVTL